MASSLYFFDLETSGVSGRRDRIMQFAGQRTDMDLKPLGEPDNILIRLTPDVLPQPEAILVTGIAPQATLADGITEAEFLDYFVNQVNQSDSVMVGFNNIRFDNEFIRFTLWRNFYDAYEWSWKNGCSTWDLLDVARMTRALRPEGIKWPFAPDGKPSNRLELLASINELEHANAHDALSDVLALVDLARLIKTRQPRLFSYLFNMRDKKKVAALVNAGKPFIYTSGRYPGEYEKTALVVRLADHPDRQAALVYDLRLDPDRYIGLPAEKLAELWNARGPEADYFPVKVLAYNRCPAVAPLNVLDDESKKRLAVDITEAGKFAARLAQAPDFIANLHKALGASSRPAQTEMVVDPLQVDGQLYDGFINDVDKRKMSVVRAAKPQELAGLNLNFADRRLEALLPLYKARNFPQALSADETVAWERFRYEKLALGGEKSVLNRFFARLNELAQRPDMTPEKRYLLEELNLYAQTVSPLEQG